MSERNVTGSILLFWSLNNKKKVMYTSDQRVSLGPWSTENCIQTFCCPMTFPYSTSLSKSIQRKQTDPPQPLVTLERRSPCVSLGQFPAAWCPCQCVPSADGWRRGECPGRGCRAGRSQDWCQVVTMATGWGSKGGGGERQCYHGNRCRAFLPWVGDAAALM